MQPIPVALGVRSNPGREKTTGSARLVNCYVEAAGEEGKAQLPIYACNGFTSFVTLTSGGAVRAGLSYDSATTYWVSGSNVYKVTSAGTVTTIGAVASSGHVGMARNRAGQIGIVISGTYYVIDSDVLSTVDVSSFPTTFVDIVTMDGYFILIGSDGEWYVTAIDNATSIDGLDFEQTQSSPDGLVAGSTRASDLVLFGERSTEFWNNSGTGDFPFSRVTAKQFGCYAVGTVAELLAIGSGRSAADTVVFAASSDQGAFTGVALLEGYEAVKISPPELDRLIRAETSPDNLTATAWSQDGHSFYVISGTGWTWSYDTSTGFWHERESGTLGRWQCSHAVQVGTKTLVGDYAAGTLYEMKPDAYDEAGTRLTVTIVTPPVHAWPNPLRFYGLYADMVSGVGLTSGDDADTEPTVSMRHSNDGGNTWTAARTRKVGASGAYGRRVKFMMLGQSREDGKVFELTMSARTVKGVLGLATTSIAVTA